VHCDVKPSNLLVRGDDVRLIDFGIARYVGERCGEDGTVQCSRGWAAPEQLRMTAATPAVDVFAWGCLLALLASGIHPFASKSEEEWILRVQSALPDLNALPAGLDGVVRACLARDPQDRPSAADLVKICQRHGRKHARSRRPDATRPDPHHPSVLSRQQFPRPDRLLVAGVHQDVAARRRGPAPARDTGGRGQAEP
jgi:serine/threonine protein kinase